MRHDGDTAHIKVRNALALLVEEEVVQTPDGGGFFLKGVERRLVAENGAVLERHFFIEQRPHVWPPGW